jgi:hypothetical protein
VFVPGKPIQLITLQLLGPFVNYEENEALMAPNANVIKNMVLIIVLGKLERLSFVCLSSLV